MRKHKLLSLFIIFILFISASIFYAVKIEPYRLTVEQVDLNKSNGNKPLKILQISDLHLKGNFNYRNLSKIVNKINEQDPDIVIFTGDLYDHYGIYHDDVQIEK